MPEQFPRLNLETPKDLDYVLQQIRRHAHQLAKLEFDDEFLRRKPFKQAWDKSVDVWTATARQKLEPNLLFNGYTLHEYSKQSKATEPFDEDLSKEVQTLAEQSDRLTEEVIGCRKSLPTRRAEAMQRRAEVLRALEEKKEKQRARAQDAHRQKAESVAQTLEVDLPRKDQVKRTLDESVDDITGLQVSILEQATAAAEQTRLVKKLRSMPP
ncbi:uncharacterized protein PFL1_01971 [Pseudozyma flocculosa PF-1]|uniref:Uncharacterized protein n=1 Tax=Pseudozyma flocculosa TaxID=84751 RepID=A0A5C3EZL5_9BASI|nr:uncharacterized protein PFL1_01971 [Pseudozyma flocculosa PF-1]EPQ30445.1 hypothetical protein PFL1_01971 [Pseudozyma flocculosa PF-1]SPO37522.1 uncharacterized protein PSFLO_02997 [Pseudozyma flocculosa]